MREGSLQKKGIRSGIVNAAGDLTAWGYQPMESHGPVGIADPNASREIFSHMTITDTSVATSGNYEKFVVIDGKNIRIRSILKQDCLSQVSKASRLFVPMRR
jgi:thiamine biosynthesis lipoprotein